jgi:hypothetical protein
MSADRSHLFCAAPGLVKPGKTTKRRAPVLGYKVPVPAEGASSTIRPRPRRLHSWIKIRMHEFYLDRLRALASCIGTDFKSLVHWALTSEMNELEAKLGISGSDAVKLTPKQRASIARKFRAVSQATGCYIRGEDRN